MNTNEQAPECCPFCGAGFKGSTEDGVDREYRCGTWVASEILSPQRTLKCATAERERLTRERDALRVHCTITDQCLDEMYGIVSRYADALARVKQLESEWAGWPDLQREWFGDKYAAMQPLEAVRARIEDSEARVKRLEDAGDAIVDHNIGCGCGQDGPCRACRIACEAWNKAKEATP